MIKVLVTIFNDEKKLKLIFKKYKLSYNVMTYGRGTASVSLLRYFGLDEIKKNIYFSIVPTIVENNILNELNQKLQLKQIGKGIAFTIKIASSNKYLSDNLKKGEDSVSDDNLYELIVTIVKEGYASQVMQAAKKAKATGGTVIEGRSLGSRGTIFMDLAIEPEKDIVLNIVKKDIKKQVMENINTLCGINTEAHGVIMSFKVDNVIGLQDD